MSRTSSQPPLKCRSGIVSELQNQSALKHLESIAARVDQDLQERLSEGELPHNLREAVRYAVLGGGKRLRPVLTLLCCEAVGGVRDVALPAAAAIELVHCFSLVHDDLPAMDDDGMRRGQPTLHIQAGEAMAVLAGDVMVSLAFDWILRSSLDDNQKVAVAAELASATTSMIGGQVYDTLGGFESGLSQRQRLQLIHRNKTAALLRASCRMGAVCGSADPDTLEAISRYGDAIGLMFQIIDDLLDVTQSAEHTGKATGKDESAGKLTFPGLLGIPASEAEVARLREAAHAAVAPLGDAAQSLLDLCDIMAVRTK